MPSEPTLHGQATVRAMYNNPATSFLGKSREALFGALASSAAGLNSAEAVLRQQRYGKNQIVFHHQYSSWLMLAREFTSLFPLMLLAASLLSFFAHVLSPNEGYELIGVALAVVVALNAMVSFNQNRKVEKLMISFLDYIPKQVALLRDGERCMLDAKEAVPGDILFIQEGDKISADGIVLESSQLVVDESIITGESEPVGKDALNEVVDASCQVSSGATVVKGSGTVLICSTGRSTSIGGISRLSQEVERLRRQRETEA